MSKKNKRKFKKDPSINQPEQASEIANEQEESLNITTEDIAEIYAEACELEPPAKLHSNDDQRIQYAQEIANRA